MASEAKVDEFIKRAESLAGARIRDLLKTVTQEKANLGTFATDLTGYERRTKALGGTIAARSFRKVLDRIASVVLDAEVGLIDVAWKQKDDKAKDIQGVMEKRSPEYNLLESVFQEVTGD